MLPRGGRPIIPSRRVPQTNRRLGGPERPPELKHTYELTPKAFAQVKRMLRKATRQTCPPEIVDIIMDMAEYWVCSTDSIDYSVTADGQLEIPSGREREDRFILRTKPLGLATWHIDDMESWQAAAPAQKLNQEYTQEELQRFSGGPALALTHPFRKIVFNIVSKDQGWTSPVRDRDRDRDSKHPYRGSNTWFDAGVDRFDKKPTPSSETTEGSNPEASSSAEKAPTTSAIRPVWPELKMNPSGYEYDYKVEPTEYDKKIQCNLKAHGEWTDHNVEWLWTDDIDPESAAAKKLEENGRGRRSGDGTFVKDLKPGDMVTVWGRTRYGQWVNHVQKVEIKVYWAL
ncbi:hypothetical protein GGR51DRAFT_553381 [Nemania sp. FL0031]|nr:hypothetical protein GGR51DRAFT_553381 [Nemania sp. FL0031]